MFNGVAVVVAVITIVFLVTGEFTPVRRREQVLVEACKVKGILAAGGVALQKGWGSGIEVGQ